MNGVASSTCAKKTRDLAVRRFSTGENRIKITDGLVICVREAFYRALPDGGAVCVRYKRSIRGGEESLKEDLVEWWRARDGHWLRDHLTRLALRFGLHHELAHVMRGHLFYAAPKSGLGVGQFRHSEVDGGSKQLWQVFEFDADRIGADFFVRTTALGP